MSEQGTVVVVGSCMIDFVSYAPRLPESGETIHGSKFVTNFGGKGANQCVAAAKLGAKTTLVARVGDDIWADKYIENLTQHNVNTSFMQKTDNFASGVAQITVSDDGANQIVIVAGANTQLNETDVLLARDAIENAAVLVCQLETCQDVAVRAMQLCKGISILNGAPALTTYSRELLKSATIFCVNESEAKIFTGVQVDTIVDAKAAIKVLFNKGCHSVLITLGAEGAVYASKDSPNDFHHVTSPKVKCVDSTGAGDSFIGALAFLLANKKSLGVVKSMEIACQIAADAVTRPGTQISYPGPEILDTLC